MGNNNLLLEVSLTMVEIMGRFQLTVEKPNSGNHFGQL